MKKTLLLSFLLTVLQLSYSQTTLNTRINIKIDTFSVPKYMAAPIPDPEFKKLYLEFGYGDFALTNPKEIEAVKNGVIKSVELVYTRYPKDQDLTELNERRIGFLHLLCPSLFGNPVTQWSIISQTNCKSEAAAKNMFHGFVIIYKPAPTAESSARELAHMMDVWKNKTVVADSSVLKVFRRNKWTNMTVATDLTGSMSPYLSQVFLWYKLTFATKKFSEFIFFNDGDMTDDRLKKTGKAGGVYYCKGDNKDSVLKTAAVCMKNGYGGDCPENNVEAILYAAKKNPGLKEVIMIADNWAPMRDYGLMSQVKIPVHIILCGQEKGVPINTEYLDLARHTKGSLHTMEEDINKLTELAEGKTIEIGGFVYRVSGGKFLKIGSKT
ncbi:MAG: hypothetical protein K0S33_3781 [Bacteroidetes bacterium]|jgi:hypothetical protein|nr:hypothetical protein [Bacteroidota bacterium]